MFGYVSINPKALTEEEQKRFRAVYCGLCHVLYTKYGNAGRLTLSNDMTFLALVLGALYEPTETARKERCVLHPVKPHPSIFHTATEYAADMNILLAYNKCLDDRSDERQLRGYVGSAVLKRAYAAVKAHYPKQCQAVQSALEALRVLEKARSTDLDALSKEAGKLLSVCFGWKRDVFQPHMQQMGDALGGFVYLMDAYEDYDRDVRYRQFNPLTQLHEQPDYEECMEEILTMKMADCARAFEFLPITQDEALIRNILYSGVWGRYTDLRRKRKDTKR